MLNLIEAVRNAVAYRKTRAALDALPVSTLLDLDICSGDIKRVAREAVYGAPRARNAYTPRPQLPRFLVNPARA